jgi:mannose-6-phosphate isomerase-like protein (cupin superfamily)
MTDIVRPARMFRSDVPGISFTQRFTPGEANLQFLNCGEFHATPDTRTEPLSLPGREALLFQWRGTSQIEIDGERYDLAPYDVLYIPLGSTYVVANPYGLPCSLVQASAPAANRHPVFHAKFEEFREREERIRRLKGKDVYLMFDVSEPADKLVAGYTFFQPHARSWPPHNHTDQEEVYVFIKGQGSMEVYESPETMTFVHNVSEGDMVSIPFLNYHPVFTQEHPLEFIWCIAGERYWVGDKNKAFMDATVEKLTT